MITMTRPKGALSEPVIQVLAVGAANVELILPHMNTYPRFNREVVVPEMALRAAGSAANFALCSASLGIRTGFAGRLAVDRFSEVVLQTFREMGVDTKCLGFAEKQSTGITVTLIREDSKRAFITYKGTNAQITLDDLLPCIESGPPPRWLHLAGYHLLDKVKGKPTQKLLAKAQGWGATTSLDTGWDPAGWSSETIQDLQDTLKFVDVFFPNITEVHALSGERSLRKGARRLIEMGATAVIVKREAKGCLVVTPKDQQQIPAFEVEMIDTNAAGDAFDAGFVASMLSGATLARAAVFANAVAALHASRKSHQTRFPSLQETTAFLMRQRPLDA